jgi:hypothetical protein
VNFYGTLNCCGAKTLQNLDTTCTPVVGFAIDGNPLQAVGAVCSSPVAMPTGSAAFTEYAQGCAGGTASGTCASGLCVPTTSSRCVWQAGQPTCPNGYPHATVIFDGIIDGRGCTACTCSVAGTGTCQPTVQLYGASDCSGGVIGSTTLSGVGPNCQNDPSCFAGAMISGAMISVGGAPGAATCGAPSGGAPTGQASGSNPTTVCCTN